MKQTNAATGARRFGSRIVAPMRFGLALLAPFLLAGCSFEKASFLQPHGTIASAQRGYFLEIILILLIVVLPVLVLTPLFAWRYRYKNSSTDYRPNWGFSWPLEFVVWGVPVCIVIVMGFWLWRGTHDLDPYRPLASNQAPLVVDVVGYDWKWLFIYPSLGIASVGEMAFPVDRPLNLELTSATVMQSFMIPSLGSQIYAMAGMTTHLHLDATAAGRYRGENTQYNGDGFPHERFTAAAMSPQDFDAWVKRVSSKGMPLTRAVYENLRKRNTPEELRKALMAQGSPNGVTYFRDVPPKLFDAIVASFHANDATPASPFPATIDEQAKSKKAADPAARG